MVIYTRKWLYILENGIYNRPGYIYKKMVYITTPVIYTKKWYI